MRLAVKYQNGINVDKSLKTAKFYYEKAAEQGIEEGYFDIFIFIEYIINLAIYQLAFGYYRGDFPYEKNIALSLELYQKAFAKNHPAGK